MKIRTFVVATSAMVALLFFGGSYWAVSRAFNATAQANARESASAMAKTTFSAMYELMSTGWNRLRVEYFLQGLHDANSGSRASVELLRGPLVEDLFGKIDQAPMDRLQQQAFAERRAVEQIDNEVARFVFPLKADGRCLRCHTNAAPGDVLGMIEVRQNLAGLVAQARSEFFSASLMLIPFAALLALAAVWWVERRIQRALETLEGGVASVNAMADLRKLELPTGNHHFAEVNRLFGLIDELVTKLRSIAVDKDMLKFEIGLLEKFVITSDIIRDWREYVNHLVVDINRMLHAHVLFSIFQIDNELFDLEIFWYRKPSAATRERVERHIQEVLQEHPRFSIITSFNINHHIAEAEKGEVELEEQDVRLRVKSFFVDTPKIGGIVGIGVHADELDDETRHLVLDSVLSTLLNVVGSVKAIYKYTRDLEYYATRDPLTDLYNQRVFWEMLAYEIDRARRHDQSFGLLLIDLDNFKLVNDNYGHPVGDKCLQQFARAVQQVLRSGDIFARYGGDEFVVILPEADIEQAGSVAHRILDAARSATVAADNGDTIHGTASIGLALYPDHASEPKDIFLFADNMMYKAKAAGKERVAIPSAEDVMDVFRDLSQKSVVILNAIEEKRLLPFFQPILDVASDCVVGYEVLSRIAVDGQLMRADEFVEIAEKMGVIHRLDCVVIELALARAKAANHQGYLFLNLSPRALVLNEFAKSVRKIVAASGISPERIVFEITERDTVKNISLLERFLNDLKFDGFRLAIDDFGSGFSSFHYLRRFPIDFLKVEGDFIANILSSAKDRAFVQSMQSLAHQLGIRVIAEFVESAAVLDELRSMGMDMAQGYHIGRPASDLLRHHWREGSGGHPALADLAQGH